MDPDPDLATPKNEDPIQIYNQVQTAVVGYTTVTNLSLHIRYPLPPTRYDQEISWNKGKKHSEDHRLKTSLVKIGNLNCLRNKVIGTHMQTGEQIEFIGAKAINAAGFTHTAVYDCANWKRPHHKGFTWVKESLENK